MDNPYYNSAQKLKDWNSAHNRPYSALFVLYPAPLVAEISLHYYLFMIYLHANSCKHSSGKDHRYDNDNIITIIDITIII